MLPMYVVVKNGRRVLHAMLGAGCSVCSAHKASYVRTYKGKKHTLKGIFVKHELAFLLSQCTGPINLHRKESCPSVLLNV